jgi:hypothetical protein
MNAPEPSKILVAAAAWQHEANIECNTRGRRSTAVTSAVGVGPSLFATAGADIFANCARASGRARSSGVRLWCQSQPARSALDSFGGVARSLAHRSPRRRRCDL